MGSAIELPGHKNILRVLVRYGDSGATKIDIAKATELSRHEIDAKVSVLVRLGFVAELNRKCFDSQRTDNDGQGAALYVVKGVA
jgi:hypothetical protein